MCGCVLVSLFLQGSADIIMVYLLMFGCFIYTTIQCGMIPSAVQFVKHSFLYKIVFFSYQRTLNNGISIQTKILHLDCSFRSKERKICFTLTININISDATQCNYNIEPSQYPPCCASAPHIYQYIRSLYFIKLQTCSIA